MSTLEDLLELVQSDNQDGVETLLRENMFNLNECVGSSTVLHAAVEVGNAEMVELQIYQNASSTFVDYTGHTALQVAITNEQTELYPLLLRGMKERKSIHHFLYEEDMAAVAMVYLDLYPNLHECDDNGNTPQYLACMIESTELVTKMLNLNANVNQVNIDQNSALVAAIFNNDDEILRILVNHGADVNHQFYNGYTPFFLAAERRAEEILDILCEEQVDPYVSTEEGIHAIYMLAQNGNVSKLSKLHEWGYDQSVPTKSGKTIFHVLEETKNAEQLEFCQKYYNYQ